MTLVYYRSRAVRRNQRFRFKLLSRNGAVIAISAEGYANREDCRQAALMLHTPIADVQEEW